MLFRAAVFVGLFFFSSVQESLGQAQPPSSSQQKPQEKFSRIDQRILQGEIAYASAVKALTESQKKELHGLEVLFYSMMVPIMESYDFGGKLIFCMETDQAGSSIRTRQQEYVVAYRAYHASKIAEQAALWKTHRAEAGKITFIDHALMDKHYEYIETVQKMTAEQMVDRAIRTGVYRQTDCAALQLNLDEALSKDREMGPAAPGSSSAPKPLDPALQKDPSKGTLGTIIE